MTINRGMTYDEFSRIYACTKDLIKATSCMHDMVDQVMEVPEDIYITIITLHNRACDFIEAYRNMYKED